MDNLTEKIDEFCFSIKQKKSEKTAVSYRSRVKVFFEDTGLDLNEITGSCIDGYLAQKENEQKPATIALTKIALNAFLDYAGMNIDIKYQPPKTKRTYQPIPSESDVKKIIFYARQNAGYVGVRNPAIICLLYHTGIRPDECQRLGIEDLDLDEGRLYVFGKGAKRRTVPLNDVVSSEFERYIHARLKIKEAKNNSLFLSHGKNRKWDSLGYGGLRGLIRKELQNSGFSHLSPYSFRHAFATRLFYSGTAIETVAKLMGHEKINSLFDYITPSNFDDWDAVKALEY